MKLTVEHNPSINAWDLKHEDVRLVNDESIAEWRRQVMEQFEPLAGRHAYVLIDLKSFELSPAFAQKYSEVGREIRSKFDLTALRYGDTDGWTAMTVELQGAIGNYASVVFADRDAALAALTRLRAQPAKG